MRLVYKTSGEEVQVGDQLTLGNGEVAKVTFFRPPHKASSSGKVSVSSLDGVGGTREYYVSAIGAEWVEREDRQEESPKEPFGQPYYQSTL